MTKKVVKYALMRTSRWDSHWEGKGARPNQARTLSRLRSELFDMLYVPSCALR